MNSGNKGINSINGIKLPDRVIDRLNEAAGFFGDSFREMIIHSIEENVQYMESDTIKLLQDTVQKESDRRQSLEENEATIKAHFKNGRILLENETLLAPKNFIDKLRNSNPTYMSNYKNIIYESEEPKNINAIEGDGDTPESETPQEIEPQVDENGNPIEPQVDENGNPIEPQVDENGNPIEPQMSDEQKLQLELAQTDSKFTTVVLYDKIIELLGSIRTIKENMSASKTETELDMYLTLEKYESYLEILNELIFVMDLNTIYYNVVNIMIEVNDLLNKYLISTKVKILNDKSSSKEAKDNAIADLKINNNNNEDSNDELDNLE